MKILQIRQQKAIELIYIINTLRQDCLMFSKIMLYQLDKKARHRYYGELLKLEEQRIKRQNSLIQWMKDIDINQFWKAQLFSFSNRIYKLTKSFNQKIYSVSSKFSEFGEGNTFLQNLRNNCILFLTDAKKIDIFIRDLQDLIKNRYQKDANYFAHNSTKLTELLKKSQTSKENRYLLLLKDNNPQLFLSGHQKSLLKIDIEINKLQTQQRQLIPHPLEMYQKIMDLEQQQEIDQFYLHNGMIINTNFYQEGLCQFLTTKWVRILKQLRFKNQQNYRIVEKYGEKCQFFKRKSKSSSTNHKLSNLTPLSSVKIQNLQIEQGKTVQMNDLSSFGVEKPFSPFNKLENEQFEQKSRKYSVFKVQKLNSRKRSHTLRPLGQSKQNKQVVHQKIIQMKLIQNQPQVIKNMRIRKRRPFPILKDQNCWSLLMKENQSKLAICIN